MVGGGLGNTSAFQFWPASVEWSNPPGAPARTSPSWSKTGDTATAETGSGPVRLRLCSAYSQVCPPSWLLYRPEFRPENMRSAFPVSLLGTAQNENTRSACWLGKSGVGSSRFISGFQALLGIFQVDDGAGGQRKGCACKCRVDGAFYNRRGVKDASFGHRNDFSF